MNITSIEIGRGWSKERLLVTETIKLRQVVDEANTLQQRLWQPFIGKPGACVMRVEFYAGDARILSLIVNAKGIIRQALNGEKQKVHLLVRPNEFPNLHALLISFGLPERCAW